MKNVSWTWLLNNQIQKRETMTQSQTMYGVFLNILLCFCLKENNVESAIT